MQRTHVHIRVLTVVALLVTTGGAWPFSVRPGVKGDSSVGADVVSEVTWQDRQGLPRTVHLVTRSVKYNPGWLSRYVYDSPSLTCNAVDGGSGGLTDVSHNGGMLKGKGRGAWSSRGHRLRWLFKGAHHGIVRIEYEMPFSEGEKQVSKETIRVVRDLLFADGVDHILYAITLDFSKIPRDKASVDTRSPYMRWDWNGRGAMGPYTGFRAGTDGTLTCEDTTTSTGKVVKTVGDNKIPFAYEWNDETGRCEAIVATRPYAELPQGSECWAGSPDPIIPAGIYTRDQVEASKLPYQLGGYSGWMEKLTWQVPYDLGHERVVVGKYQYRAWPAYSYAVTVLLDRMEHKGFERILAEQELIPSIRVVAATGRVVTAAAPGPGREQETAPLATPGYDPLLRAWRFECMEGKADVTIDAGSGTLANPLLIFSGFRGKKLPRIPDALVSLDRKTGVLYVTVEKAVTGPVRVSF